MIGKIKVGDRKDKGSTLLGLRAYSDSFRFRIGCTADFFEYDFHCFLTLTLQLPLPSSNLNLPNANLLASCADVLYRTSNLVISRRGFLGDAQQICQNEKAARAEIFGFAR